MKLSIITVNLNNRCGLKRTIESVVAQTSKDFEWIVIDGGSTDGSKELLEEHSFLFAYWVSEPDNGIFNAMNKGVARASGEYMLSMQSNEREALIQKQRERLSLYSWEKSARQLAEVYGSIV